MASIPASVYDPSRVLVTYGIIPLIGRAPGRSITIRRDATTWSTVDGTNGEFKRRRSRKKSGTVEVVFRGTAPVNRGLGILAKIDERNGTLSSAPLAITDTLNGALFLSTDAFIETFPDMVYGQQEGDITWRFRCNELDMTYPGISLETLGVRLFSFS